MRVQCLDTQLFYNNGRANKISNDQLCPDPMWPASDPVGASKECTASSARQTK